MRIGASSRSSPSTTTTAAAATCITCASLAALFDDKEIHGNGDSNGDNDEYAKDSRDEETLPLRFRSGSLVQVVLFRQIVSTSTPPGRVVCVPPTREGRNGRVSVPPAVAAGGRASTGWGGAYRVPVRTVSVLSEGRDGSIGRLPVEGGGRVGGRAVGVVEKVRGGKPEIGDGRGSCASTCTCQGTEPDAGHACGAAYTGLAGWCVVEDGVIEVLGGDAGCGLVRWTGLGRKIFVGGVEERVVGDLRVGHCLVGWLPRLTRV